MSAFLTPLYTVQTEDVSHQGRGTFRLTEPLVYQSDLLGKTLTVPTGFETDFASVPRVPMIFDWLGDRGNLAATLHDWLYTGPVHPVASREIADEILHEALIAQGVGAAEAEMIYAGVRLGGASHYD